MAENDNNQNNQGASGAPEAPKQSSEERRQAKRIAKEQQRLNLWRSRVHLVREARDRFLIKDFPGAVVAYEKYFRVLEIIYEAKPNEIQVAFFNNSARAKELVVIASAYWDLVRIYDQSSRFGPRLQQCADKLSEFLPHTPIYGELLRKIEEYKKNAKNKEVFEALIKKAKKKKGRCFIATAAFEDPDHPTVLTLREYRDQILLPKTSGRMFTDLYYQVSPPIAELLDRSAWLRNFARHRLEQTAQRLRQKYNLK